MHGGSFNNNYRKQWNTKKRARTERAGACSIKREYTRQIIQGFTVSSTPIHSVNFGLCQAHLLFRLDRLIVCDVRRHITYNPRLVGTSTYSAAPNGLLGHLILILLDFVQLRLQILLGNLPLNQLVRGFVSTHTQLSHHFGDHSLELRVRFVHSRKSVHTVFRVQSVLLNKILHLLQNPLVHRVKWIEVFVLGFRRRRGWSLFLCLCNSLRSFHGHFDRTRRLRCSLLAGTVSWRSARYAARAHLSTLKQLAQGGVHVGKSHPRLALALRTLGNFLIAHLTPCVHISAVPEALAMDQSLCHCWKLMPVLGRHRQLELALHHFGQQIRSCVRIQVVELHTLREPRFEAGVGSEHALHVLFVTSQDHQQFSLELFSCKALDHLINSLGHVRASARWVQLVRLVYEQHAAARLAHDLARLLARLAREPSGQVRSGYLLHRVIREQPQRLEHGSHAPRDGGLARAGVAQEQVVVAQVRLGVLAARLRKQHGVSQALQLGLDAF
mmetsp:Transcript_44042/g.84157  ORF Transcript_44042/g.84157 Transcript_44042/m.84157 type:complete len:499 (+) Transcript_44042:84-1580(+)